MRKGKETFLLEDYCPTYYDFMLHYDEIMLEHTPFRENNFTFKTKFGHFTTGRHLTLRSNHIIWRGFEIKMCLATKESKK